MTNVAGLSEVGCEALGLHSWLTLSAFAPLEKRNRHINCKTTSYAESFECYEIRYRRNASRAISSRRLRRHSLRLAWRYKMVAIFSMPFSYYLGWLIPAETVISKKFDFIIHRLVPNWMLV